MSGIVFLKCADLGAAREFYTGTVGMRPWLEQEGISILRHGNFLVGFHQAGAVDRECLLTFFYGSNAEVDAMHSKLGALALGAPKVNERYRIYHFFAKDPEGRTIEFQRFLHDTEPV